MSLRLRTFAFRFTRVQTREATTGMLLGIIALVIGWQLCGAGSFGDEADKLAAGRLLAGGLRLYGDLFSHHFPLTYYWSAAVFHVTGASLLGLRASVLLFQVVVFGSSMLLTRLYLPLGMTWLLWNLISPFFYGNLLLYNVLAGLLLIPVFWLTLALMLQRCAPTRLLAGVVGLGCGLCLITDPIGILPFALVVSIWLSQRQRWPGLVVLLFSVAAVVLLLLLWLLLQGTFQQFLTDVVWFNLTIYSRYYNTSATRFAEAVDLGIRGLYLLEPSRWMQPNSLVELIPLSELDRWLLLGMAGRVTIWLGVIAWALRQRWSVALFVYLFALSLLVRSEVHFRSVPFVLLSVSLLGLLVMPYERAEEFDRQPELVGLSLLGLRALAIAASLGLLGLNLRFQQLNPPMLQAQALQASYQQQAHQLAGWSCPASLRVGVYPADPYLFFFSPIQPIDRYLFTYPWVMEYDGAHLAQSLTSQQPMIVKLDRQGSIWGRANQEYLQPLIKVLDQRFQQQDGWYINQAVVRQCRR